MLDSNPYRAPLERSRDNAELSTTASLVIGFLIDGVVVLACVLWVRHAPWLRVFLPFAAGHAVGAALIVYRASKREDRLNVGDHFFLRYGAIIMAGATAILRQLF